MPVATPLPQKQAMATSTFKPNNFPLCVVSLALAIFMYSLDLSIANVALPNIAGNLGASSHQSTWVVTAFAISNAIALPLTGWLARRIGEVRLFILATGLFTLASALCGLASNMGMLVGFRALQGFVSGPMFPVTQALMIAIYPAHKRAQAIVSVTIIGVTAPIIGPIMGGWITDNFSWPWIFYINVPVGILCCYSVWKQMGHKVEKTEKVPVDYVGLCSLAIGVSALQIVLDLGHDQDWFDSNLILILAVTAFFALALFLIWELTDKNPIVDLRIFRHYNFSLGALVYTLAFGTFMGGNVLMPLWLQTQLGYTPYLAGLVVAPGGLIPLLMLPLMGRFSHLMPLRTSASLSFVIFGLAFYWRSQFNVETPFSHIMWVQIFQGFGTVLFFIPVMTIMLSELKPSEIANGTGLAMFVRSMGGSFFISMTSSLWNSRASVHHAHLAETFTTGNGGVLAILAAFDEGKIRLALAKLEQMVNQQAYQIAFNEVFRAYAILVVVLMLLIWFCRPPFSSSAPVSEAAA